MQNFSGQSHATTISINLNEIPSTNTPFTPAHKAPTFFSFIFLFSLYICYIAISLYISFSLFVSFYYFSLWFYFSSLSLCLKSHILFLLPICKLHFHLYLSVTLSFSISVFPQFICPSVTATFLFLFVHLSLFCNKTKSLFAFNLVSKRFIESDSSLHFPNSRAKKIKKKILEVFLFFILESLLYRNKYKAERIIFWVVYMFNNLQDNSKLIDWRNTTISNSIFLKFSTAMSGNCK